MAAFKSYARRAAIFATCITALSLLSDPLWQWLVSLDVVGYPPKILAVLLGGVHNPSLIGLFVGFFIEWFVICAACLVAWEAVKRRRASTNAT